MNAFKVATFITSGHWLGKNVVLEGKYWESIIDHMLDEIDPIFQNLSGFTPISSLINKRENIKLFTNVADVQLSDGIELKTHCHEITQRMLNFVEVSPSEKHLTEGETYLINRKKKWIIWHWEVESNFKINNNGVIVDRQDISKFSKFEKVYDLTKIFSEDKTLGCNFMQKLYEWLEYDVKEDRKKIERKMVVLAHFRDISKRAEIAHVSVI